MSDTDARNAYFVYEGERIENLVFPLGGVGSGGLAITGNGSLVDWSIRNKPNLRTQNGLTHFALKAETESGEVVDARVLSGPYQGHAVGAERQRRFFDGYGFGANRNSLAGIPHFSATRFTGKFPTAEIEFLHDSFPASVKMSAFSPFIPHNERDSGMPIAMFEIEVTNSTEAALDYTLASVLANFERQNGDHQASARGGRSYLRLNGLETDPGSTEYGCLTLAMDVPDADSMEYLFRGQWFDDLGVYWRDFSAPGRLKSRRYEEPRDTPQMFGQYDHGAMAYRFKLEPGETRSIRAAMAWYFPNSEIYWFNRTAPDKPTPKGDRPSWRYFYATQWSSSSEVAEEAFDRWDELWADTCAFRDAVFDSTVPVEIADAAVSTMALLRTQTVIRLDDGTFWGWEGQHADEGCCEGTCTHVWNYQQALPYIFPELERSLRSTEFLYNQQPDGGLTFRQKLPHGCGLDHHGPCADGHFGAILKTYRDWKLCGDTEWLGTVWEPIKRAMAYTWSPDNPDKWDPQKSGLLTGKQHHTLDMELLGPNSWLSTFYVGALFAAAEMAEAMNEPDLATEYRDIAQKGAARIDAELFNGTHYFQATDLSDRALVDAFAETGRAGVIGDSFATAYWSDEHQQQKYQFGEACHTDQLLGLWHAELAGMPSFLDSEKSNTALKSIFDNNFIPVLTDHVNPNRVYAYEDEGGVVVATWPKKDTKPVVPAPYSEEIWTGIEYAVASHMILRGFESEGLEIVRTARKRHDGRRRSPWNEIECGSYYARSMSAFATLTAWMGQRCDMVNGRLGFVFNGTDTRAFWATGTGWGTVEITQGQVELAVAQGVLEAQTLAIATSKRPEAPSVELALPGRLEKGQKFAASFESPEEMSHG